MAGSILFNILIHLAFYKDLILTHAVFGILTHTKKKERKER